VELVFPQLWEDLRKLRMGTGGVIYLGACRFSFVGRTAGTVFVDSVYNEELVRSS